MTKKQKIAFLNDYAAGKKKPKEIDYSKFTDDELRWTITLQDKIENNSLSGNELKELNRLEQKIIWI